MKRCLNCRSKPCHSQRCGEVNSAPDATSLHGTFSAVAHIQRKLVRCWSTPRKVCVSARLRIPARLQATTTVDLRMYCAGTAMYCIARTSSNAAVSCSLSAVVLTQYFTHTATPQTVGAVLCAIYRTCTPRRKLTTREIGM